MEPEQAKPSAAPGKLRIAGVWSGVLEVDLETWTLPMLREEISRRAGGGGHPPDCINLISAGKVLRDPDGGGGDGAVPQPSTLLQVGLKGNAKILASAAAPAAERGKVNAADAEAVSEAERSRRLARIRAAAEKLTERNVVDGSLEVEDFNIELEDQNGQKVMLGSETDRRGVMMGLMLHANAKKLMKMQKYRDALDVLAMGEEAFSLCDPKIIEMIDNVPILEIDTVWCYFMLREISWLSMAGRRLSKARKGFERSHGKDSTRFRLLQPGRHAELAIYLRLELLEGVVAYHSGHLEQSRKALTSAHAKFIQLQVPDEALSLLMSMGYKQRAAKRALRMTNQDVQSAVDFLVEERDRKIHKLEEDHQQQSKIMEQKKYGMTPQKKVVDLERLNELVSIGFERYLAAEALRVNENDTQKALDDLTNPETNSKLQLRVERRKQTKASRPSHEDIENLVAMGFDRSAVIAALPESATKEEALSILTTMASSNDGSSSRSDTLPTDGVNQSTNNSLPGDDNPAQHDPESGSSGTVNMEERDDEMEEEIARELTGDPLADYDIEVAQEGEAITEYLVLLESAANMTEVSHR